jgi:hypothetical protein
VQIFLPIRSVRINVGSSWDGIGLVKNGWENLTDPIRTTSDLSVSNILRAEAIFIPDAFAMRLISIAVTTS